MLESQHCSMFTHLLCGREREREVLCGRLAVGRSGGGTFRGNVRCAGGFLSVSLSVSLSILFSPCPSPSISLHVPLHHLLSHCHFLFSLLFSSSPLVYTLRSTSFTVFCCEQTLLFLPPKWKGPFRTTPRAQKQSLLLETSLHCSLAFGLA